MMKTAFPYKGLTLAVGVIPVIVCMVFCIFLPDSYVVHTCFVGSALCLISHFVWRPSFYPNFVWMQSTWALGLLSAAKAIGGDWLLPDRTIPLTLEILLFCLSLSYLLAGGGYHKLFPPNHRATILLNRWAMQFIAWLSGVHLLLLCLLYVFFHPFSEHTLYFLAHITPPLLYVFCLFANYRWVRLASLNYLGQPILRIVPIYNGKIYVSPRKPEGEEPGKFDLPMERFLKDRQADVDLFARDVQADFYHCIDEPAEAPRFILKHEVPTSLGCQRTILLYVLPLKDEAQIHFEGGKFIAPGEMNTSPDDYSSFLKAEAEYLTLVTTVWQRFN